MAALYFAKFGGLTALKDWNNLDVVLMLKLMIYLPFLIGHCDIAVKYIKERTLSELEPRQIRYDKNKNQKHLDISTFFMNPE